MIREVKSGQLTANVSPNYSLYITLLFDRRAVSFVLLILREGREGGIIEKAGGGGARFIRFLLLGRVAKEAGQEQW